MTQVRFFICNEVKDFNAKRGELEIGGLYFIKQTRSILRASTTQDAVEFGRHIEILASSFPDESEGHSDTLYLLNGNAYVFDNSQSQGHKFVQVFVPPEVKSTVVESNTADASLAINSLAVTTYISNLIGNAAGKIPVLDNQGKLNPDIIPSVALSDFIDTVESKAGLTGLTAARKGDWAKVDVPNDPHNTDNGSYILSGDDYSVVSNWKRLADKVDEYTIDAQPTSGSGNLVSSGAIFSALAGKIDNPTSTDAGKFLKAVNVNGVLTVAWASNVLEWETVPAQQS